MVLRSPKVWRIQKDGLSLKGVQTLMGEQSQTGEQIRKDEQIQMV